MSELKPSRDLRRPMRSLTYEDWCEYRWIDVTAAGDDDRQFVRDLPLTPVEQADMRRRLKGADVEHRPRHYPGFGTIYGAPNADGQILGMGDVFRAFDRAKESYPARLAAWMALPWWRRWFVTPRPAEPRWEDRETWE